MITVGTKVKITGDNLYGCVGTVLVVQKLSAVKNPEYLVRLNKDNPKSIRCGWSVDAMSPERVRTDDLLSVLYDVYHGCSDVTFWWCEECELEEIGENTMINNKPVKFDMTQKDSGYFKEYINKIIVEEAKKYAIPIKWGISTEWTADGQFKIAWYDNDGQLKCVGTAKCHPEDAFNPEIGVRLAVTRAVQNMRKPFIPYNGQLYYYVDADRIVSATCFLGSIEDKLKIAMGNCFKTSEQAQANVDIIMKRLKKAMDDWDVVIIDKQWEVMK